MAYLRSIVDGPLRRLTAGHLRTVCFPSVRRWRGYDRTAVHAYLNLVADEITRLHADLAAVRSENDRITHALKKWQSEHASTCRQHEARTVTRRPWPINAG